MTKAKTKHERMKFRNRWLCQRCLVSAWGAGPVGGGTIEALLFASFHCSFVWTSATTVTLRAMDPQISQTLFIFINKKEK